MTPGEQMVALLTSIDQSLKRLVVQHQNSQKAHGSVASDRDLDGQYGNPVVRTEPRDWTGPSYKGAKFSDCPPGYLRLIADMLEQFAENDDAKGKVTTSGNPTSKYKRADAARARGWALRVEAGKVKRTDAISTEPPKWAGMDDEADGTGNDENW